MHKKWKKKKVKHFDKLNLKTVIECINPNMDTFLEAWDIVVSTCSFSVLWIYFVKNVYLFTLFQSKDILD
jgi:hypothetical protein